MTWRSKTVKASDHHHHDQVELAFCRLFCFIFKLQIMRIGPWKQEIKTKTMPAWLSMYVCSREHLTLIVIGAVKPLVERLKKKEKRKTGARLAGLAFYLPKRVIRCGMISIKEGSFQILEKKEYQWGWGETKGNQRAMDRV